MGIFCFNSKRDLEVVGWKVLPAHCFILGSAPKAKSAFTVYHTTASWTTILPQTRSWYLAHNFEYQMPCDGLSLAPCRWRKMDVCLECGKPCPNFAYSHVLLSVRPAVVIAFIVNGLNSLFRPVLSSAISFVVATNLLCCPVRSFISLSTSIVALHTPREHSVRSYSLDGLIAFRDRHI
jgi:hypothetical protein